MSISGDHGRQRQSAARRGGDPPFPGHSVQFYNEGQFPSATVARHLADGLAAGQAALVIATGEHGQTLLVELGREGERALADGRLTLLDASEMLTAIHVDGVVDDAAFDAVIGQRARTLAARHGSVCAFGEMVDILCRRGNAASALALEGMWNRLRETHSVTLLCVYGLAAFEDSSTFESFAGICETHSDVQLIEPETHLSAIERSRLVAHLEQRRGALDVALERRRQLELERDQHITAERFLAEAARILSSSLDSERTAQQVAELTAHSFADLCVVDLLASGSASFDRVAVGYRQPADAELAHLLKRRYPLRSDSTSAVARAIRELGPQLLCDVDDAFLQSVSTDDEHLSLLRRLRVRSTVTAPLVARSRPIGAITLIACDRNFDAADVWLTEQLAANVAAAVVNARLYAAESRARIRMSRMQEVTAALSRASTPREVADVACRVGAEVMDAHFSALWIARADGALALAGSYGAPNLLEEFDLLTEDSDVSPAAQALRTGNPAWVETDEDFARISPEIHARARAAGHVTSFGVIPLVLGGKPAGAICFVHPIGHTYDDDERAFYIALAQHCSQALDRARLLDAERRSNERLRLLTAVGEILSSSLDVENALTGLARGMVPTFADWLAIHIRNENELRLLAVEHADPGRARSARADLIKYYSPRTSDNRGVGAVLATGRTKWLPTLTDDDLRDLVAETEALSVVRELHLCSFIEVPVFVDGQAVASLSFMNAESGRLFEKGDRDLAEEVARRAGAAIERANLYASLQGAAHRAEEANRIKDEFLATVSHELRTPLNAISGWASLLSEKLEDPGAIAKGLEVIRRNARVQTKIVEDILDVARIVTGKLKLDPRPVDMLAILRDGMDVVRPSADAKQLTLTLDTATSAPCLLVGDAQRLQQVLWNLLSNAVKFTDRGGRVTAFIERDGAAINIRVSDTGRGIGPDFLPYVFDRFKQADSSTSRKFGGLGLGLAIVRHIVELHGGRVSAESPGLGEGATFHISLPIRAVATSAPSDEVPAATTGRVPNEGDPPLELRGEISGIRILVLDDEPDARDLLQAVLCGEGAFVQTASSVREALEIVARSPPDVIVSDIGMPEEDGYVFIQRLRGGTTGAAIPAIALTAYVRTEDRVRALTAGFNMHVPKPVDARELIAAIANLRALGAHPIRT